VPQITANGSLPRLPTNRDACEVCSGATAMVNRFLRPDGRLQHNKSLFCAAKTALARNRGPILEEILKKTDRLFLRCPFCGAIVRTLARLDSPGVGVMGQYGSAALVFRHKFLFRDRYCGFFRV